MEARARRPISVSIVIPVYNSENTIGQLCDELVDRLNCDERRLQIVLVDDGSRDNSRAVCQQAHERHPEVITCVMLSRNFGEHNAVMAGLHFVTGDYCVIMDDDFQNPPEAVTQLLDQAQRGYDVVYARYETKEHSSWRNLGSRLHNLMATYALQKPKHLYLSSFKLMSRFVVQQAVQYTGPDPYLDAIILRATRNIATVTVPHQARENGTSGYTLRKLFALWSNMMVTFSVYPLRIVGLFGLVMALVGVIYGGQTLLTLMLPGVPDASDLEQLSASLWFFRGGTLLAISIIGEYIGRIHRNLTAAPQYIVRHALVATPAPEYQPLLPVPFHHGVTVTRALQDA